MIRLVSFGFKHEDPPPDVGRVVDVRHFRNPHHDKVLRKLRGTDTAVQQEVGSAPGAQAMLDELTASLRDGDTLAFACLMGRHRSVAMAEMLGDRLRAAGHAVTVTHRHIMAEKTKGGRG